MPPSLPHMKGKRSLESTRMALQSSSCWDRCQSYFSMCVAWRLLVCIWGIPNPSLNLALQVTCYHLNPQPRSDSFFINSHSTSSVFHLELLFHLLMSNFPSDIISMRTHCQFEISGNLQTDIGKVQKEDHQHSCGVFSLLPHGHSYNYSSGAYACEALGLQR